MAATLAEHLRNVKQAREALERAVEEVKAAPEEPCPTGAPPESPSIANKPRAPASSVPEYLVSPITSHESECAVDIHVWAGPGTI